MGETGGKDEERERERERERRNEREGDLFLALSPGMKQGGLSPWLCLEHISLYPLYFQSYFRIPSHAQCSLHSQCYFANRHILTRAFSIDRAHTAFTLAEFVQLLIPSLPSYVIPPSHSRLHIPASQKVSITDQQKVEKTTKIAQNRKKKPSFFLTMDKCYCVYKRRGN